MNDLLTHARQSGKAFGGGEASQGLNLEEATDQGILFLGASAYGTPYGDAFLRGIADVFDTTKVA